MKSNIYIWLKRVLGVLVGLFIVALFWGGYLIFRSLPSPEKIARSFKSNESHQALAPVSPSALGHDPLAPAAAISGAETASVISETPEQQVAREKNEKGERLIRDFLREDLNDIRVCNNLGTSKILDDYKDKPDEEKGKIDFGDWFADESRSDSLAETFRFPLKAVLQDSTIKPLLDEVFDLEKQMPKEEAEKESFLNKIGFYSRATAAVASLYTKKDYFEYLSNRSVHLGVLTKIAHLKPELRTDPRLNDFCQKISRSMTDRETVDLRAEREQILDLIRESGLTPDQLDFDPKSYIKFKINSSDKGINFSLSDREDEK